jgi:hypothetical protein
VADVREIQMQAPEPAEPRAVEMQVFADYYQFYVADSTNTCDTGMICDAPDSAKRQIGVGDRLVAIGTKRYGTVPVRIEIYPAAPKLDLRGIDRINECGIEITTSLVVCNYISDPEPSEISIEPGIYGVRALYVRQGAKFITNDQIGDDGYIIQFWPTVELLALRHIKPKPQPTPTA